MTTEVDIVNRSLQEIGTRTTVTALELTNNSSNEAIQANLSLRSSRDELLRKAPWNCSTSFANMTYITSVPGTPENQSSDVVVWEKGLPSPPWAYEYQYPVDCIRPILIVPQITTGFTSGVPITSAVTGGASSLWMGPPVRFKVEVDQFFVVTSATVNDGGFGHAVGDVITLSGTPPGDRPIGAPVQLLVTAVVGDAVSTVSVVDQIYGSAAPLGGSYFAVQASPVAQDSSSGDGTGSSFDLVFGSAKVDQRVILTNQENATLSYLRRVTDPNVMDSLFLDAWCAVLGAQLAMALTGDKSLANLKINQVNDVIREARSADGNEGLTVNNVTPDWIRTRGIYYPYSSGGPPGMGFDWGNLFPNY